MFCLRSEAFVVRTSPPACGTYIPCEFQLWLLWNCLPPVPLHPAGGESYSPLHVGNARVTHCCGLSCSGSPLLTEPQNCRTWRFAHRKHTLFSALLPSWVVVTSSVRGTGMLRWPALLALPPRAESRPGTCGTMSLVNVGALHQLRAASSSLLAAQGTSGLW